MNQFLHRFIDGVDIASTSFALIFRHLTILVYLLAPAMLALSVQLIMRTEHLYGQPFFALTLAQSFSLVTAQCALCPALSTLATFIASFLATFIITFFSAALIHHVRRIIRNKDVHVGRTLATCWPAWKLIAQWALVLVVVEAIILGLWFFAVYVPLFAIQGLSALLTALWGMVTFLVLPFLIISRISVVRAIKLSWLVVRQCIPELFGGWTLIVVITLALILTLLLPNLLATGVMLSYIMAPINSLVTALLATVRVVFKTIYYDRYYEKPLEELAVAEHDLGF
jgi:hypothetical protein